MIILTSTQRWVKWSYGKASSFKLEQSPWSIGKNYLLRVSWGTHGKWALGNTDSKIYQEVSLQSYAQ